MSITQADVLAFFQKLETEGETEIEKGAAIAGQFLRSTFSLLAKDPVLLAAVQAGFSAFIPGIAAAVETGGSSVLVSAALSAAQSLLVSVGKTAEHELVPIVQGEFIAKVSPAAVATPQVVHP